MRPLTYLRDLQLRLADGDDQPTCSLLTDLLSFTYCQSEMEFADLTQLQRTDTGTASLDTGTASLDTGTASRDTGTASLDTGTASLDTGTASLNTAQPVLILHS